MNHTRGSHRENPIQRTVDAFWSTGTRDANEHTLRIPQSYDDEDFVRMEAIMRKIDANCQVRADPDHSNIHVVSETPLEKFVTSLSWAGYEVLEVF